MSSSAKDELSKYWNLPVNKRFKDMIDAFDIRSVGTAPPARVQPIPPPGSACVTLRSSEGDALVHPGVTVGRAELFNLWDSGKRQEPHRVAALQKLIDSLPPVLPAAQAVPVFILQGAEWKQTFLYDMDLISKYTLLFETTSEESYAQNALSLIRGWTDTVQRFSFDHSQSVQFSALVLGWCIPAFANAVDLLKYTYRKWTDEDTIAVEAFALKILPHLRGDVRTDPDSPYTGYIRDYKVTQYQGWLNNWHTTIAQAWAALAVVLDDPFELKGAILASTRWIEGRTDPKDPRKSDAYLVWDPAILLELSDRGIVQEFSRDSWHAGAGITGLFYTAETAWQQGFNLYGYMDSLLYDTFEMACRFANFRPNVFSFVDYGERPPDPTKTRMYNDKRENAFYMMVGSMEVPYNHYANRCKKPCPQASKELASGWYGLPEGSTFSWGYGTLTHAQPR